MTLSLLLLFLALAEKPDLIHPATGPLTLKIPSSILNDPTLERRLLSGLTMSIELETHVTGAQGKRLQRTLLTIRYDVWEERIQVQLLEPGSQVSDHTFAGIQPFVNWLTEQGIVAARVDKSDYPLRVKMACRVIPYSAEEARATREWFSQHLKVARSPDQGLLGGEGTSETDSNGVFEVLMSSGIRRHAVLTFHWRWRFEQGMEGVYGSNKLKGAGESGERP